MTPEEVIRFWRDDKAEHFIVWAQDWHPEARGVLWHCELCGRLVSVWPVVVEKAKADPLLHIICKTKCMPLSVKDGPVPYGGSIKNNELPESLR